MKALSLFGVFVIAKLIVLAGHPIEPSVWMPIAYIWQDLLVVLVFAVLDAVVRRPSVGWTLYASAVGYVAINVPVERVLSSPLTWPMLGAARGTLSDSIRHHVTTANLALIATVAAAGILFPPLIERVTRRLRTVAWTRPLLVILALPVAALGPFAVARVDTVGLDRNPLVVLATSAFPRISATNSEIEPGEDWRASAFDHRSTAGNLSRWLGVAAGRNVVMVLLESAGARYLAPYRSGPNEAIKDPMPNLSELARNSIVFENAYSVYPESIKGLFSVLCSRYPAIDTDAEIYARVQTPSIAAELKSAGYRTALFHSGRFMYLGMEAVVANRGYDVLEDAGAIGGNRESSFGVDEPSTVRRALAWIDSLNKEDRFFLTYLPIAGHHPYETPEPGPFPEKTDADRYLNALHYADQALGSIITGLRERGLADQTVFVIFGDHGEAFGQHPGNYGHSLLLYEENIRVPYLIVAPGLIDEQIRAEQVISLIDTGPTILDLVGLKAPAEYQGRSALAGESDTALFYTDYSLSLMGVRDGCWKYLYELDSGRSKLFDLCEDPGESKDMSALNPERIAAYRNRVTRWSAAQKGLLIRETSDRGITTARGRARGR